MMTVSELIEFLQQFPGHLPVAYRLYSEQCLLDPKDIEVVKLCPPRPDGWIQNQRPDIRPQTYLRFPGN